MKYNLKLKTRILEQYPSQADFAQAVGSHESDISRVVRNRRQPTKQQRRLWAARLDCNEDIFEKGD